MIGFAREPLLAPSKRGARRADMQIGYHGHFPARSLRVRLVDLIDPFCIKPARESF